MKMNKILATTTSAILGLSTLALTASASQDKIFEAAQGTATIDGVLDDSYSACTPIKLSEKITWTESDTQASADATAYILYDDNNLYIYVDVVDTVVDCTGGAHTSDSVEIMFTNDGVKTSQTRISAEGDYASKEEIVESKVVKTDKGYAVEAKANFCSLNGNLIPMCLQINSCSEGTRQGILLAEGCADGEGAWSKPELFWSLKLPTFPEPVATEPVTTEAVTETETEPVVTEDVTEPAEVVEDITTTTEAETTAETTEASEAEKADAPADDAKGGSNVVLYVVLGVVGVAVIAVIIVMATKKKA